MGSPLAASRFMTEQDSQPDATRTVAPAVTRDVFILGLPFWNPTYDEFHAWWNSELVRERDRGTVIGLVNAHTLNQSVASPEFRKSLEDADVLINDGIGYRLASRMRGVETKYNLNGTDLVPRLLSEAANPITVFLYGATESSNRGAAEAIAKYANVRVVGRINGYVDVAGEAIPAIQSAKPDVLLVALGHPKQEMFCVDNSPILGAKILLPCGGLFDFMSDTKPRAPGWMRSTGLEWAYRLSLEPRRMFARYVIGNPIFLMRSFFQASRDRELLRGTRR